jgi:hypothetical protein
VNTNDSHIRSEIVDGETMYIPDEKGWTYILQDMVFAEIPVLSTNMRDRLKSRLEFVQRYPEFEMGLFDPKAFKPFWFECVLLKTECGWQRVHIESLLCEVCGWYGATANPMIPDLYMGTSDKWAAMDAADKHKVLPCPKCGSKLPRHSIWVEPLVRE